MKNKVKVTIAGRTYNILSDESESYVKAIGDEVGQSMIKIKKGSKGIVTDLMAAILAAMDFCDICKKSVRNASNIGRKINEYTTESNNFQMKLEELQTENEVLKMKIAELETKLGYKIY